MFSCACWPSVCFLWENLYWDLLPIFNQVVLFFWYWIISTVYIFWILTLIGYIICKYFLSFSRLYFCFVDVPLLCRSLGQVVIVQSWSHVQLFETLWLWTAACEASLFFTIFKSLLKLMSIELVALLLFMPSIIPSIRVFSNESALWIRWPGMGASVFPMNIQGWFPLGLTGLISLLFKGLSRIFFSTTVRKHQFSGCQPFLWSNSHIQENHSFDCMDHCWQSHVSAF